MRAGALLSRSAHLVRRLRLPELAGVPNWLLGFADVQISEPVVNPDLPGFGGLVVVVVFRVKLDLRWVQGPRLAYA
jgi:hypothetical protein